VLKHEKGRRRRRSVHEHAKGEIVAHGGSQVRQRFRRDGGTSVLRCD
jgi:hypothetical protein